MKGGGGGGGDDEEEKKKNCTRKYLFVPVHVSSHVMRLVLKELR